MAIFKESKEEIRKILEAKNRQLLELQAQLIYEKDRSKNNTLMHDFMQGEKDKQISACKIVIEEFRSKLNMWTASFTAKRIAELEQNVKDAENKIEYLNSFIPSVAQFDELEANNKLLREALKPFADDLEEFEKRQVSESSLKRYRVAKQALEGKCS